MYRKKLRNSSHEPQLARMNALVITMENFS